MKLFIILILTCLAFKAFSTDVGLRKGRIIGGVDVDIANYPHQLSLRRDVHICGASLIGHTQAVTAAHCGGLAVSVYSILGGTTDVTVTDCDTCVLRNLTAFTRHGNFVNDGNQGYPNDIATVTFSPVTYNNNLRNIIMSNPNDGDYAGVACSVTGWGTTSPGGIDISAILQGASMVVLTNEDCADVWGAGRVNDGHICVSDSESSVCGGDSGGPIVCNGKLAGTSSWGEANCSPIYPSVYSRASYFYAWILSN